MPWKNKIILISLVFLLFFGKSIFVNIVFLYWLERYMPDSWGYTREKMYNMLLSETQSRESTKTFLQTLEKNPITGKESETYELLGDVALTQLSNTGQAILYYRESQKVRESERVKQKLSLLEDQPKKDIIGAWSREENLTWAMLSSGTIDTGSLMIDEARKRLETDSKNRGEYVSSSPDDSLILRDTIDFLDTNTERVDW